jgi:hypothetical protein
MKFKKAERSDEMEQLKADYPFITYVQLEERSVVGIVQNATPTVVNMFDLDRIRGPEMKKLFLELGARWWFGSNTRVPIDIFMGERFDVFRSALVGYSRKEIEQIVGPTPSVRELYSGRIKRRKVEFLKS